MNKLLETPAHAARLPFLWSETLTGKAETCPSTLLSDSLPASEM